MSKYIPMQHAIPNSGPTGYTANVNGYQEIRYGAENKSQIIPQPASNDDKIYVPKKKEITVDSILNPPKQESLAKAKIEEKKEEEHKQGENSYNGIIHKIEYTDTLDGISIKYGISKDLIRMENSFLGDEIYMFKKLRIPYAKKVLYTKTDKFDIEKMKKDEYYYYK